MIKKKIKKQRNLDGLISLTKLEQQSFKLPFQITPHYLSLIDSENSLDPLLLQLIPQKAELDREDLERRDPLGEEDHEAVPHLVHRYPDRVLLLVTDRCLAYCRFCTRKRWVGQGPTPSWKHIKQALEYIKSNPEIKEVVISGGDPLSFSNQKLELLLQEIKNISSVEYIRIHTRALTFDPDRITHDLINIFKKNQPIFLVTHFNHPNELPEKTQKKLLKLSDSGISIFNQSVLLKNINDKSEILINLFRLLTKLRVKPYYLHQCDIALGTKQFRVPLKRALELVESLRGKISGHSIPTFVIDIPGGFGKVPLYPSPIVEQDSEFLTLQGFSGKRARYPLF